MFNEIYNTLKAADINVYMPAIKQGKCTEPFCVVTNGATDGSDVIVDVEVYVPVEKYSLLETTVNSIITALESTAVLVSISADTIASGIRAHKRTLKYKSSSDHIAGEDGIKSNISYAAVTIDNNTIILGTSGQISYSPVYYQDNDSLIINGSLIAQQTKPPVLLGYDITLTEIAAASSLIDNLQQTDTFELTVHTSSKYPASLTFSNCCFTGGTFSGGSSITGKLTLRAKIIPGEDILTISTID